MVEKKKKQQLTSADLLRLWPIGDIEVQFHPVRRWRFDWAFTRAKVAVELDGYTYHSSRPGWLKDMEKFNEASLLGWHVFHVTPKDVESGKASELMSRVLKNIINPAIFPDATDGQSILKMRSYKSTL